MKHRHIAALAIAVFLVVGADSANAQNYAVWLGWPTEYQRGFIFAELNSLIHNCENRFDTDCKAPKHYLGCLKDVTDEAGRQLVEKFVARHPEKMSQPIHFTVLEAIFELCGPVPD